MKEIKIKRKTEILDERIPTYDLTVKDSHHYILKDGTISHNTQDFISRQVAGGGCLVPGSKVRMFDNTLKNIEDIVEGDSVLTLNGGMEIENIWTFEKKTYRIEFEDNTIIECSEDHRFFTGNVEDDPLDDNNWILARDLVKNNEVSRCI
jgi:intein/homing endonuclease